MVMAPYVPVPACAQMEARFTVNGQLVENVMYFRYFDGSFADLVPTVGGFYKSDIADVLQNSWGPHVTLRELYFTDLAAVDGPVATYTTGLPLVGGGVLDEVANGVALVVCFRTNKRGRSFRGRNYLAGFIETLVVQSQYTNAFVADVVEAYNIFKEDVASQGYPMQVVSRISGGVPRVTGVATEVQEIVNTTPATRSQRRRNPGVGV
jgi:hypothetical protein